MATILVVDGAEGGAAAEECCRRLHLAGASTWTPSRDQDPAPERDAAIRDALERCDALLLVSDGCRASSSAMATVDLALSRNLPCYLSVPAGSMVEAQL